MLLTFMEIGKWGLESRGTNLGLCAYAPQSPYPAWSPGCALQSPLPACRSLGRVLGRDCARHQSYGHDAERGGGSSSLQRWKSDLRAFLAILSGLWTHAWSSLVLFEAPVRGLNQLEGMWRIMEESATAYTPQVGAGRRESASHRGPETAPASGSHKWVVTDAATLPGRGGHHAAGVLSKLICFLMKEGWKEGEWPER